LEFISSFRERAKTYEQEAQQLRQQGRQEQTLHSSSAFGGLDVPYQPPKPLVQRQETTKGQQEPKEDLWSFWGEEPLQAEAASKTEAAAAEATVSGVET